MFKIAWRNLRKNWRHSLASMLSITAGFMALCLFEGYIVEMRDQMKDGFQYRGMYGQLMIEKPGASAHLLDDPWRFGLTLPEQEKLETFFQSEAARIDSRVRFLYFTGMAGNGRSSTIIFGYGYDVDQGTRMRGPRWAWNTLSGRPLKQTDGDAILVGRKLAAMLDCQVGSLENVFLATGGYVAQERPFSCYRNTLQLQTTTAQSRPNAVDATIVGVVDYGLRELDDKFVTMPLDLAQRLLDTPIVTYYTVSLKEALEVPGFQTRLREFARKQGLALEVTPWQAHEVHGDLYRRGVGLLGLFRTFVLAVVVVIAAMSVVNTLTKSVVERTREIGTLRSMGFLRRHILELFAWEGCLLGLVGCGLGLVLTLAVSVGVGLGGFTYSAGVSTIPLPLRIEIIPGVYALATLGLCGVSTLAALVPARRAARMRISEALAHV